MQFKIDKKSVQEGEIVEVWWECPGADSVELTIDNGFKSANTPVERQGSKKFKLNRSNGKTRLTLVSVTAGKAQTKVLEVKVKPVPTTKTETAGRTDPYKRDWKNDLKNKWADLKERVRVFWRTQPADKKIALRVLGILLLMMIIVAIAPKLVVAALLIPAVYLAYYIFKR